MCSSKSAGPRIEPRGTPALTVFFCDVPSRTTQSRLLLRKDEIHQIFGLKFYKPESCEEDQHAKPLKGPVYIKRYSSSSPRPVKSPSDSIRYSCQKICS